MHLTPYESFHKYIKFWAVSVPFQESRAYRSSKVTWTQVLRALLLFGMERQKPMEPAVSVHSALSATTWMCKTTLWPHTLRCQPCHNLSHSCDFAVCYSFSGQVFHLITRVSVLTFDLWDIVRLRWEIIGGIEIRRIETAPEISWILLRHIPEWQTYHVLNCIKYSPSGRKWSTLQMHHAKVPEEIHKWVRIQWRSNQGHIVDLGIAKPVGIDDARSCLWTSRTIFTQSTFSDPPQLDQVKTPCAIPYCPGWIPVSDDKYGCGYPVP